jgi:hypothetical protein
MARSELNARFDTAERAFLKRFAEENGVSEAAALRMLVRRLMPQTFEVRVVPRAPSGDPPQSFQGRIEDPRGSQPVSPEDRKRVRAPKRGKKTRARVKGGK